MYCYRFAVQRSSKLFEVSSICLDTFSDSCDQRTSNLTKQLLRKVRSSLVTRVRKGIQADGGHFEQLA